MVVMVVACPHFVQVVPGGYGGVSTHRQVGLMMRFKMSTLGQMVVVMMVVAFPPWGQVVVVMVGFPL